MEYLRIDGPGLLTGAAPDWSFLTGGYLADDSDGFTGFWAMNNPQTFTNPSIGDVAATGLDCTGLTLIYEGAFGSGQVSVPLVPEPASLALLALGSAAALRRRCRRNVG